MCGVKRMSHPEDVLNKRIFGNIPEIAHEFFEFPGKFISHCQNEYPATNGTLPRVDTAYIIEYIGKQYLMNVEDESSQVNDETYDKIIKYIILFYKTHELPVISAITTTVPFEKCKKSKKISMTNIVKPIIRSLVEYDEKEKYIYLENKIKNKEFLTGKDGLTLVLLPRMCLKNNEVMLEKVCKLFSKIKMKDIFIHRELTYCMEAIIHKYAKTEKDIERLIKVIKMKEVLLTVMQKEKLMREECKNEGLEEGMERGLKRELKFAIAVMDKFGIDEALELSDFSREELISGKLLR